MKGPHREVIAEDTERSAACQTQADRSVGRDGSRVEVSPRTRSEEYVGGKGTSKGPFEQRIYT